MTIKIDPSGQQQTKWHEYALGFVAGGVITVLAGLIARKWGPGIGGLFLAFPAIFPASATLIERHFAGAYAELASSSKMTWFRVPTDVVRPQHSRIRSTGKARLGLVSMQGRVRLAGGSFDIYSKPGSLASPT